MHSRPLLALLLLAAGSSAHAADTALAMAGTAPRLYTRTAYVQALATDGETLWAATRGGLEAWDARALVRRRHYTTLDGLPENDVRRVELRDASVEVRTVRARCLLAGDRFACEPAIPAPSEERTPGPLLGGSRVTASARGGGHHFIGTAGDGLWVDGPAPRRLTPPDQICSNHIVAFARFGGRLWLGSFDEGLCTFDGDRFVSVAAPIRMVNDLVVFREALYVASPKGLFRTRDGVRFDRIGLFDGRGTVDLAVDGDALWAVSPVALVRLSGKRNERPIVIPRPGGSSALQAVDVHDGVVWLASEDRGALRLYEDRIVAAYSGARRARRRLQIGKTPTAAAAIQIDRFDRAAGLPSSWAVDVAAAEDGGALVATLRHGLVHVAASGAAAPVAGIPDPWLLHVSKGPGGGLFVGTQGGAARVTRDSRLERFASMPNPCVHVLFADGSAIWAGTEGGAALYDGSLPPDTARQSSD